MSISRKSNTMNYWPGFVDAMACLLLLFVFLLSIFIIVQFVFARESNNKNNPISELEQKIVQLSQFLALEKIEKSELVNRIIEFEEDVENEQEKQIFFKNTLQQLEQEQKQKFNTIKNLQEVILKKDNKNDAYTNQLLILNQQISALRKQLAVLESALQSSEERDRESRVHITNLAKRLNAALARRVQILSKYQSDFFGRLRNILQQNEQIVIEGDRFVFQSELFFESGSAIVNIQAIDKLRAIANILKELQTQIPKDIKWVLRVDGHTDSRPISNNRFRSNWELSSQRAIAVAQALIDNGVPPKRLVAAGFGEFQPIIDENNLAAYARNRRIEFKITER